jgi:hypothetical protein
MRSIVLFVAAAFAVTACAGPAEHAIATGSGAQAVTRKPAAPAHGVQRLLYVSNDAVIGGSGYKGSVNVYALHASGDAPPLRVVAGDATQLTEVEGIAVDASGRIYVANTDTTSVVAFASGASGNVAPDAVISGSNTGLVQPNGLAVDAAGNLYVANCGRCGHGIDGPASVEVFPPGANGNIAPARLISGAATQLDGGGGGPGGGPGGIAVDGSGNIYIAADQKIVVFGPSQNGNVAPLRVIAGKRTQLTAPYGIAVSPNGIYVGTYASPAAVLRFALSANGNAAPLAVLSGASSEINDYIGGLAVTPHGAVVVDDRGSQAGPPPAAQILTYSGAARKGAAPRRVLGGSTTQLVIPLFVTVAEQR